MSIVRIWWIMNCIYISWISVWNKNIFLLCDLKMNWRCWSKYNKLPNRSKGNSVNLFPYVKSSFQLRQARDKPWHFKERNRRPPRDPVNALLSLSYTIIGNSIGQLATIRGLDVSLGFLHIPLKGRPSLALDLVEPVRPWVDQWLWQNIQKTELLTPKHFTLSNELVSRQMFL